MNTGLCSEEDASLWGDASFRQMVTELVKRNARDMARLYLHLEPKECVVLLMQVEKLQAPWAVGRVAAMALPRAEVEADLGADILEAWDIAQSQMTPALILVAQAGENAQVNVIELRPRTMGN